MSTRFTRREILTRIAALGGALPLAKAMGILGIMHYSADGVAAIAGSDDVNPEEGKGKTVAIIGAGLSGLTAAYELCQRGYECHIFEADKRAKGRTFTVRPDGSPDSWYQEVGRKKEQCQFEEVDGPNSLYFEAGAGRIPSHHRLVLHYCKKFDVPLESYIFGTRSNLVRSHCLNSGKPIQLRHFKHNLRGYLAEMFRTANSERLNAEMSPEERQELMDAFAKSFGELGDDYSYGGGPRAGYGVQPGAGNQPGREFDPFSFADLLRADRIWKDQMYNDMRYYWQASLMQPVGGIDNIATAFLQQDIQGGNKLIDLVKLNKKVISVKVDSTAGKVELIHQTVDHLGNSSGEEVERTTVDYCISTIAPSLLSEVDNDFDAAFKDALLTGVDNVHAGKVAWQSDRFWESDKYHIYGGISWTSDFITQIWYPSSGFHNRRGILTGAYIRAGAGTMFGQMTRRERIKTALENGINLHPELNPSHDPQYHDLSKAMTISWQNMPFQAGGWFDYSDEQRKNGYQILLNGQRNRFFMAGDAMSYNPGWMEGAIGAGRLAAENVIENMLSAKV